MDHVEFSRHVRTRMYIHTTSQMHAVLRAYLHNCIKFMCDIDA